MEFLPAGTGMSGFINVSNNQQHKERFNMRHNKWFRALMTMLLIITASLLTSCWSSSGGDGKGSGEGVDASVALKFNLDGAKAIAAGSGSASRADGMDEISSLSKVLADGSVSTLFALQDGVTVQTWPTVEYIAKSPASGEIYVYFSSDLYLTTVSGARSEEVTTEESSGYSVDSKVGRFICIKTDGSFVDILKTDDGSWAYLFQSISADKPSILFDAQGRMYYILSEITDFSSAATTTAIYRFDPKTGESTPMTAAQESIAYEDFFVSNDGTYLFAKVFKWSGATYTQYLRAIPVADPDSYKNIFYSTGTANITAYAFNPDSKTVYLTGYNLSSLVSSAVFSQRRAVIIQIWFLISTVPNSVI